jgi:hypothetical protein
MADWVNAVIKAYREDEVVRAALGETVITDEAAKDKESIVESRLEAIKDKEREDAVKVRAYLEDNAHIMYMAKTQRKFTKSDLCKIKDELFFSKYNVDTTVQVIRKVLKEEMTKFDVKAYEKERGILPKVI